MKQCPKCNSMHDQNGKFCSRSCANSRVFSEESCIKKSLALKGRKIEVSSDIEKRRRENCSATWAKKYEECEFDELGITNKKRRILEEQNQCCNRCKLSHWFEEKLSLELEHKDGNTKNNDRDNLECLCPNCHSLTKTWRGRNKSKIVSDEILLEAISKTSTIRKALILCGLSAKGANYKRVAKLMALSVE